VWHDLGEVTAHTAIKHILPIVERELRLRRVIGCNPLVCDELLAEGGFAPYFRSV